MSPGEFEAIRNSSDMESATHRVFHFAINVWHEKGTTALTTGLLTVYCVETFFGEVCNGGIDQYLDNESGQLAEHCPAALRRVGLPEYAEIIEQVLSHCELTDGEEFPDPDDPRGMWIAWMLKEDDAMCLSDPWAKYNDRFFSLYGADKGEFRRQLFQYIVEHESEFVGQSGM